MPSFQDWDAYRRSRAPAADAAQTALRRAMALRMEDLQADDAWTVFQKQVETLREETQARLDSLRLMLDAPMTVGDAVEALRLQVQRELGRRDAYAEVLALPDQWRADAPPPESSSAK